MNCPRCKIELKKDPYRGADDHLRRHEPLRTIAHAAGVEIEECTVCGGVYLDHRELEKIQDAASHGKTKATSVPMNRLQRVYERARDNAERQTSEPEPLQCPACNGEMAEREWGFSTDVMVDTCLECRGVWLDFGELEALEELYR